ncbi:hypothetical protein GCM10023191_008930 [Actinoallomurus oryzae]|uniref:Uncharacterized protein n=1 Tax=Actinoallomurus oryzae TaxID=502180 RepID=A0ABP8PEP6_9ACTN
MSSLRLLLSPRITEAPCVHRVPTEDGGSVYLNLWPTRPRSAADFGFWRLSVESTLKARSRLVCGAHHGDLLARDQQDAQRFSLPVGAWGRELVHLEIVRPGGSRGPRTDDGFSDPAAWRYPSSKPVLRGRQ